MEQYWELWCETCGKASPVVATSREEMAMPDFEDIERDTGIIDAECLRTFQAKHRNHETEIRLA